MRNATAAELFSTLQHADSLLERLRSLPVTQPVTQPVTPPLTPTLTTTTANVAAYPASDLDPLPSSRRRPGLHGSSVPSILLGLGALCLLAASVIFLAVAWSWLGVGGRTAVLVALTVAAAGAGVWWSRRGLRVAGESLTIVALGLLTLDLFGAENAGWLGAAADSWFPVLVGASLAVAGVALTLGARTTSTLLVGPQLIAALGVLLTYVGLRDALGADLWISAIAVGVVAGLALTARSGLAALPPLPPLAWALVGVTVVLWSSLLGGGLEAVPTPITVAALWSGAGWALLAAAAYLAAPALIPALRSTAPFWVGASAILVTFTVALPAFELSADGLMVTALVAVAVWVVVASVLPGTWSWAARIPALAAALPATVGLAVLVAEAATRLGSPAAPYSATIGASLGATDTELSPWLLLPAAALVTWVGLQIVADAVAVTRSRVTMAAASVAAAGGVLTLSLFPVPIWTVVLALASVATALVLVAAPRQDRVAPAFAVLAGPVFMTALIVARPSAGLLTITAFVLAATAAHAAVNGRTTWVARLGHLTAPAGLAIGLYGAGEIADLSETYRAVVVVLVLGLAAVLRPRADLEISAALFGAIISGVAVFGLEGGAGPLALLLTLGGALITISALLNPERRMLGWVGGGLLAAATWVRLADIGVGTPEAYTLPSAIALLAVGGWQLSRNPVTSTTRLLGPGLVLATLPSLLWSLSDPTSLRAVVLGVACLSLALGGAALRWNSPLVVGASVGALLVLIELAPYAVQTPQWVLIGLAGAALTAVGVTWESRMQDVRHAGAYLGRLR
ncbi:SCO7613 C-terminal domain-containing membrane protein [Nocardioides salsibiostraticola]